MSFENENPLDFESDKQNFFYGSDDIINITVKMVNQEELFYEISLNDKVEDLIKKVKQDTKSDQNVFFTYKGKPLSRKKTFGYYQVESNDIIHASVRLKGGNY